MWYGVSSFRCSSRVCFPGFRTFRQKTFRQKTLRQKHGGGRFGKKNMPKRLRLKTSAETFRMKCGAYPVYARSPSPSQRPPPITIASRPPFPLGFCSCSTLLSNRDVPQLIAINWSEEKTTNESLQKIDFSNE